MTTSGDSRASDAERMAHIAELEPEIASYDAGSFNWMPAGVFENSPQFLDELGRLMIEHNVKPELEIFDTGMIYNALYYLEKEALQAPLHFQFVLGVLGGAMATVKDLVHMLDKIPEGSTWGALGIGRAHLPILYATIALGGHVRVGLEDNIYYAKNKLATNPELVSRAARLIKESNKEVASPKDARQILGLKGL
jgi:uncharacterized protein (DUF849 family)